MWGLVVLVTVDLVMVIAISVVVGASAPRWSARWLQSDPVPLRHLPWESASFFRRLRVTRWATRIPEFGSVFGGQSKDTLPGRSRADLVSYLVEVRRAEWVHWGSVAGSLVLFVFNPWWLALAFVLAVSLVNLPFLLVLRNNRLRILRILDLEGRAT